MDLVVNHTSRDSELVASHPGWFTRDSSGDVVSPHAIDPADSRRMTVWGDLAELDYRPPQRDQILAYFQRLVRHYVTLGFGGFRCDAAYKVPAEVWRALTGAGRAASPEVLFCAETLGAPDDAVLALADAGFDYLFNSVKWWDFKRPWLLEQYEAFRHIAPSIGFPESHDTDRLVSELLAAGIRGSEIEWHYRHAYAFAAAYSTGVMMPMGFEYGWSRSLDVVGRRDDGPEPKRFDLSEFIAEVNAMKKAIPALNEEGPQRLLTNQDDLLVVLERQTEGKEERAFIFVNTHEHVSREIVLETLLDASDSGISLTDLSTRPRRDRWDPARGRAARSSGAARLSFVGGAPGRPSSAVAAGQAYSHRRRLSRARRRPLSSQAPMSPGEATVDPPSRGSRLDADHPQNGVLTPPALPG
jgi:starch synthase (maltosyl-transferring)